MGREEAETILLAAGAGADADFPLLEAAIACAIHEDPSRDPQTARDLAAVGVERLGQRLKQESAEEALAAGRPGLKGAAVRLDLIALAPGKLPRHIPDAWKGD